MRCLLYLAISVGVLACQTPRSSETFAEFSQPYLGEIQLLKSTEISSSPWGIQFNAFPFHHNGDPHYDSLNLAQLEAELPILLEEVENLGVKWARVSIDWPTVEDNQGQYHWELPDQTIKGLNEKGITSYLSLNAGHKQHTDGKRPVISESGLQAWLDWVQALAERYKDQVEYYEIWNEPNTVWFWDKAPNAAEYMTLVKTTTAVIKAADPDAKIIGGSLARLDVPYAEQLFEQGIAEYIDVFSFHPYNHFPEATVKKMSFPVQVPQWYASSSHQVDYLQALIAESGKKIELWQGECGYPSAQNSNGWNGTGPWSENIQAKWILRRMLVDLSYDAGVSCYFMMKESANRWGKRKNVKGLLAYEDMRKKKGFSAFQNLCSVFHGDFTLVEQGAHVTPKEAGSFPGFQGKNVFHAVWKDQDGTRFMAYWLNVRSQDQVNLGKVDLSLAGDWKPTEFVDLFGGKRYGVSVEAKGDSVVIADLPIGDYPMVLKGE